MVDLEHRVRSSLRELTDALPVSVPAQPPSATPDGDRRRLVAVAMAICVAVAVGLVVWWPGDGAPERLTFTSQPDAAQRPSTAPAATSEITTSGTGEVVEPPLPYWSVSDPVVADAAGLLPTVTVEVSPADELGDTVAVASELGGSDRLGSVVIVHVGTDGPLDETAFEALIDEVRGVPHVVVVTTHGDRPWTATNNAMIRAVDQPDDNFVVFDWAQLVVDCPGACFTGDGIGLTADGRWYYAEQLAWFVGLDVPERPTDPAGVPVVAITADGDAVVIPPGADAPELLFAGPADAAHVVVGVAHSTAQNAAFVSLCCEPISGEVYRVPLDDPSRTAEHLHYATAATVSPTGRGLAAASSEGLIVGDATFSDSLAIPVPNTLGSIYDLDWFDTPTIDNPSSPFPDLRGQLAALTRSAAGIQLITMTDVARIAAVDHATVINPDRGANVSLAGVTSDGLVLVHDRSAPDQLAAYDPVTLQAAGTISLPADALNAWVEGNRTTWIDTTGQLHSGDTTIPGTYRWARQ